MTTGIHLLSASGAMAAKHTPKMHCFPAGQFGIYLAGEMTWNMTSSIQGLSDAQVLDRQARGLSNAVEFKTGRSYLGILRKNAFTFINTVLFAISALLVLMGQVGDALVTAGLVLLNVVVGVYQEGRAKYKLDRLALQVRAKASVIREGVERSIDPDEIVLDDVLICRAGDQILADGRVIGGGPFTIDESNLTGESERIYKGIGDPVYSGSFCTAGSAIYQIEKVGADSTINRLTAAARAFRQEKTPLQRDIDTIIRVLVVLVTLLGVLLGVSLLLSGTTVVEYLRIAAVVVALVPQGLFVMTTAAYGMGMLRVAGKGALIQEVNAVESTSHVDLLCLDKTGTLTTNQILLSDVIPLGEGILDRQALLSILGDFAASMGVENRTFSAILSEIPGIAREVSEEIPFSSEYKWSGLRYAGDGGDTTYVLGAPEILAEEIPSNAEIMQEVESQTALAHRVLLFGRGQGQFELSGGDGTPQLPKKLVPLGLVVFQEELRKDARQTLDHFSDLGVKIKIISGDHPATVAAMARQAGLNYEGILSGLDLEQMDTAQLEEVIEETTVFGRITPQQKERLIEAYRQKGYYTAMIGDGVNDILSLKRARLSVAVQSGAPATRSIADIVLLEDRFSALPVALQEGQRIIRGMLDVIRLLLTRTLYVFLLVVATQIARVPFPVTPKHNALIALLTVGIPILAIAVWARVGKSPSSMLRSTLHFVLPAAFTISFLVTGVYLVYLGVTNDVPLARTALTAASIFCGLLLLPFVEPPNSWWVAGDELSGDPRPSLLAFIMLALFGLVMSVPVLRGFFELVPLGVRDYLIIAGLACLWALLQRMIWRGRVFERLVGMEAYKWNT